MLGRKLFQDYKAKVVTNRVNVPTKRESITPVVTERDRHSSFSIGLEQGIRQNSPKIARIRHLLTRADSNVARSAGCHESKPKQPRFLPSPTYASYSLSYQSPSQSGRFGWLGQKTPTWVAFSMWWTAAWKQLRKICAKPCTWFGLKVWVVPTIRVTNATLKSLQVLPSSHQTKSDFCTLLGNLSQLSQCSLL